MMGAGTDYGFGRGPSLWGEESGFWGCSLSALNAPQCFVLRGGNKNLSLGVLYHTQEVRSSGAGTSIDGQETCLKDIGRWCV
jgi:hypothetical protein